MKNLLTLIVLSPLLCYGATSFTYEGLNYSVLDATDKTCEVASNTSATGDIVIPSQVFNDDEAYTVTKIGEKAFSNITSITIPASVKSIVGGAFYGCKNLAKVTIEDSEGSLYMGEYHDYYGYHPMFYGSSVTTVYLGRNINYFNYYHPFRDQTKLQDVTMGENVTEIGWDAFAGCTSLTSFTIPQAVTIIKKGAFSGCSALTSVNIPGSVASIENDAFKGCTNLKYLNIEDGENVLNFGCKVTSSGTGKASLFEDCPLESLYLGRNINISYATTASGTAYYSPFLGKNKIIALEFGDYVTDISSYTFSGCSSLDTLRLPNNIKRIGEYAFSGNSKIRCIYSGSTVPPTVATAPFYSDINIKAQLYVPKQSIEDYKNSAFWNGFIRIDSFNPNAKVIDGLNYLLDDENATAVVTFDKSIELDNYSGNTDIIIPETVERNGKTYAVVGIDDYAFAYCWGLKSVTLPEGIAAIGDGAFEYCTSLRTFTTPASLRTLGNDALTGCSALASVKFNEGLLSIGDYAMFGCTGISHLILPSTVASIGHNAFMGVHWVNNVTTFATVPHDAPVTAFSNNAYDNATLHVPLGTLSLYQAHPTWSLFGKIKEDILSGVDAVDCSDETQITIVNGAIDFANVNADSQVCVTTIDGTIVFQGCPERIEVAPGIYIVTVNGKTTKVMVK